MNELIKSIQDQCRKMFGIDFPITSEDFKKARNDLLKSLHPDKTGENTQEATEKIVEVKEVFDRAWSLLDDLNGNDIFYAKNDFKDLKTVFGTPLSELGKGLGATVNGSDCEVCHHAGYTKHYKQEYKITQCDKCEGTGSKVTKVKCNRCVLGKFTLKNGKLVDCRACNGKGERVFIAEKNWHNICLKCFGTGELHREVDTEKVVYHTCSNCYGKGEIPIKNPLLQKGGIGGGNKISLDVRKKNKYQVSSKLLNQAMR